MNKNKKLISVDAIVRRNANPSAIAPKLIIIKAPRRQRLWAAFSSLWYFLFGRQRFSLALVAAILFLAFFAGMSTVYQTGFLKAENGQQQEAPAIPGTVALVEGTAALGPINNVPNDVLFNMSLGQLENYLNEVLKTPEVKQEEIYVSREKKLKEYLASKNSPFVEITNTIARLKHWKLVLAISNSESTLGKRCYNNNCSGIGVAPGHPLWRNYSSKREWAKDLDRLLDKRYQDWTLERMNGVYNQPGSKNWLLASKQVLEELQENGIE